MEIPQMVSTYLAALEDAKFYSFTGIPAVIMAILWGIHVFTKK
jgi:hypothetical protein